MSIHEIFLLAIHKKKLVKLIVNTKEKGLIERLCVPYDFGPSKRANLKSNPSKYHFFHNETKHPSAFLPEQIIELKITDQDFDPGNYVKWPSPYNWFLERDWGIYS